MRARIRLLLPRQGQATRTWELKQSFELLNLSGLGGCGTCWQIMAEVQNEGHTGR